MAVVGSLARRAGAEDGTPVTFTFQKLTLCCPFGRDQLYVVPDDVTEIRVDVQGAQGGPGDAPGEPGDRVRGTVAVTPGETLTIDVGSDGHDNHDITAPFPIPAGSGGWPNGGNSTLGGGGGGGWSVISRGTTVLASARGGGGGPPGGGAGGGSSFIADGAVESHGAAGVPSVVITPVLGVAPVAPRPVVLAPSFTG